MERTVGKDCWKGLLDIDERMLWGDMVRRCGIEAPAVHETVRVSKVPSVLL